ATSYPVILQKFLDQHKIQADIRTISGSVEIGPGVGLSDAICDIVSTGSTLRNNGLEPFVDVLSSQAILIGKKDVKEHEVVYELLQPIQSVIRAKETKYAVLKVKKEGLHAIVELLPGVKVPTVVPVAVDAWVAVHTVISDQDFWEKIINLNSVGAQG